MTEPGSPEIQALQNPTKAFGRAEIKTVISILLGYDLSPSQIADYIFNLLQKNTDTELHNLWVKALGNCLPAIDDSKNTPRKDNATITEVATIVASYLGAEATADSRPLNPEIHSLNLDWDNPDFGLETIGKEVDFMSSFSPEFKAIVKVIEKYTIDVSGFEIAIYLIESEYADKPAAKVLLYKIIDSQVLKKAAKYTKPGYDYDIPYARSLIEKYISDPERKKVILGKMDILFEEINDVDPYS